MTLAQIQSYWAGKSWAFARLEPGAFASGLVRKALFLSAGTEYHHIHEVRRELVSLSRLPVLRHRWVFVLGLAGLLLAAWRRRMPWWLWGYWGAGMAGLIGFSVKWQWWNARWRYSFRSPGRPSRHSWRCSEPECSTPGLPLELSPLDGALRRLMVSDPGNRDVWVAKIDQAAQAGRFTEAHEVAKNGAARFEEDGEIRQLEVMMRQLADFLGDLV